ncbi:peptidoglycan DD-metalloendopeptidase family protein [Psychroserpens sp. XS_ASV72]|uniref:peptidoglycan DD-metalloendopeptidase family protein n=1 Tax=Psychroserpens sp. XS_ASV72 TaxID=3241293 RepID=UPI0035183DF2
MPLDHFQQLLHSLGQESLHVLSDTFSKSDYVPLDLSKDNPDLQKIDVSSSEALGQYIDAHIEKHHGKIAYGGYLETRHIYRRSTHFNNFKPVDERNIHLGLDLWIAAETPIFTPLDAEVHSFKNNTLFGDYGPTIILKHQVEGTVFFTLYGHLSLESLTDLTVGQLFKQGDQIAALGAASVNGDYPPHLHFQIIKDIQEYVGDYPGVCSQKDLAFYKANCPDPNLMLQLY